MSSRNYTAAYKSSNEKISHFYHSKQLVWLLIILGVGIRTYQYLANRALRGDEAYLVLNILNRSLPELWEPLDYSQAAPIGFLLLEALTFRFFGNSEFAFRLFPFFFGIASVFLFYRVSKTILQPWAVPIALGFFAVSDRLIFWLMCNHCASYSMMAA
jgi:predicted membrane-bound mannosyltransferase